jgi:hypothetical protein
MAARDIAGQLADMKSILLGVGSVMPVDNPRPDRRKEHKVLWP